MHVTVKVEEDEIKKHNKKNELFFIGGAGGWDIVAERMEGFVRMVASIGLMDPQNQALSVTNPYVFRIIKAIKVFHS